MASYTFSQLRVSRPAFLLLLLLLAAHINFVEGNQQLVNTCSHMVDLVRSSCPTISFPTGRFDLRYRTESHCSNNRVCAFGACKTIRVCASVTIPYIWSESIYVNVCNRLGLQQLFNQMRNTCSCAGKLVNSLIPAITGDSAGTTPVSAAVSSALTASLEAATCVGASSLGIRTNRDSRVNNERTQNSQFHYIFLDDINLSTYVDLAGRIAGCATSAGSGCVLLIDWFQGYMSQVQRRIADGLKSRFRSYLTPFTNIKAAFATVTTINFDNTSPASISGTSFKNKLNNNLRQAAASAGCHGGVTVCFGGALKPYYDAVQGLHASLNAVSEAFQNVKKAADSVSQTSDVLAAIVNDASTIGQTQWSVTGLVRDFIVNKRFTSMNAIGNLLKNSKKLGKLEEDLRSLIQAANAAGSMPNSLRDELAKWERLQNAPVPSDPAAAAAHTAMVNRLKNDLVVPLRSLRTQVLTYIKSLQSFVSNNRLSSIAVRGGVVTYNTWINLPGLPYPIYQSSGGRACSQHFPGVGQLCIDHPTVQLAYSSSFTLGLPNQFVPYVAIRL